MSFNPQNMYECEVEKKRLPRKYVDTAMTIVGLIASISSVPQVLKIWSTGDISGISLTTQILGFLTVLAWLSYGIYIKNKPLMITTSVTAVVLGVVVVQIIYLSA